MKSSSRAVAAFVFFTFLITSPLYGQGTVFTYQGRLDSGGSPANGDFDFVFTAYDSVTTGNGIGGPVTNANVSVVAGLFTTAIDFANQALERYLLKIAAHKEEAQK